MKIEKQNYPEALAIVGLLIVVVFILRYLKKNKNYFYPVNSDNKRRNCDHYGCGEFGASRTHGKHQGIDFLVKEDQKIKAPFDCVINRYGNVYDDNSGYKLIEIKGTNKYSHLVGKIMYIKDTLKEGVAVAKGKTLCLADDISKKFDSRMGNHVHFEVRSNGSLIDPSSLFG